MSQLLCLFFEHFPDLFGDLPGLPVVLAAGRDADDHVFLSGDAREIEIAFVLVGGNIHKQAALTAQPPDTLVHGLVVSRAQHQERPIEIRRLERPLPERQLPLVGQSAHLRDACRCHHRQAPDKGQKRLDPPRGDPDGSGLHGKL